MINYDDLDDYEAELEAALQFDSVKNVKEKIAESKKIAENTLRKDKKITIRVSSSDISMLKRIAVNEGLPYQTLITSVLHKYATGQYSSKNQID